MKDKFSNALAALITIFILGGVVLIHAQSKESLIDLSTFGVEFTNCVESIGVTPVETAKVRTAVPNQFVLVGEGQPVTPLVVRTAKCGGIALAGQKAYAGEIVQIGAVVVPPDGSGDINNYTLLYYTSDLRLALRLVLGGVPAQFVPTINYDYHSANNSLLVRVPLPGLPRLEVSGTVSPSNQPAGSFVANWWQVGRGGFIKMSTNVPSINIGGANLNLAVNPNGPLGQLIGGDSTGFPILQQFNTFSRARLHVSDVSNVTINFPAELSWGPPGTTLPLGADIVSPANLLSLARQDGFQFITSTGLNQAVTQDQARVEAARRLVSEVVAANPQLAHLVPSDPPESPFLHRLADGNYRISSGDERFITHGVDWLYEATAASLTRTPSRANLEANFKSLIDTLPRDQRQGLPAVTDLSRLSDSELATANRELVMRVEAFVPNESIGASGLSQPTISQAKHGRVTTESLLTFAGTGCHNHESRNIYATVDWPMKQFTTRVRNQGSRGTCVAHAIVAAMESRVLRQFGLQSNFSEQELYARAKGIWFPTPLFYGDGLHGDDVLDELLNQGTKIDAEARWPYNPSNSRVDFDPLPLYTHSCDDYPGFCSDTNHQMKIVCTPGPQPVCGYVLPPGVNGGGLDPVKLTGWVSLWNSFEPENSLASIRAHLNAGHPVVFAFAADGLFKQAADLPGSDSVSVIGPGVVNSTGGTETIGGHEIVIVGYLPNGQIPDGVSAPPAHGGGYLIAKNSWGCKGDGGYMYLAYDWVVDQARGAYAVTDVSTTAIAPESTLEIDKSVVQTPSQVNLTAHINNRTRRLEIFRGSGTDHRIFDKTVVPGSVSELTGTQTFTSSVQNGIYMYWARATDQFGNQSASNQVGVNVQIDDTNPQVHLTADATAITVPGTLVLHATASDNVGVTKVRFYRGLQLLGEDMTAPYSLTHQLSLSDLGVWPYVAIAFDAAGNQKMSNVVSITGVAQLSPIIFSFNATPTFLPAGGGTATLSWNVSGANEVSISPGIGAVASQGSMPVNITENTTFVLTATNAHGTTTASAAVAVLVVPPPIIQSFTATPPTLPIGGGTTNLAWGVLGSNTTISIDNGVGDVTGLTQKTVTVGSTTTFQLTATNTAGTSTRQVTVTVASDTTPPQVTLAANPSTVQAPGSSTLTATANDDVGVTKVEFYRGITLIDTDTTPANGFSTQVAFTTADAGNINFTAKAYDATGNVGTSAATTITVQADTTAPNVSLSANPGTVQAPGSTTLTATATDNIGVVKVEFFRGSNLISTDNTPGDGFSTSVAFTSADAGNISFTARAYDAVGNSNDGSTTVTVLAQQAPVINSFTATPNTLPVGGGSTTLAWQVTGTQITLLIDQGVGDVTGLSSKSVTVGTTTTYHLTATNPAGSSTSDVTVTVASGNTLVKGFGVNSSGQLGLGNTNSPLPSPTALGNLGTITDISGGAFFTLFLKADGTLMATGSNNFGQLGDGTTTPRLSPVPVQNITNAVAISAGHFHSLALLANGNVMSWGSFTDGATGGSDCGGIGGCSIPGTIPGLSNVIAIEAGNNFSLALKSDGTVWAWGANNNGQLGDGTLNPRAEPMQVGTSVAGFNNIVGISAGQTHAIAVKSDGTVWLWGSNVNAEVGNGASGGNQLVPVQNSFLTGIVQVSAGSHFSVARRADGTVLAWGFNVRGEMGDGTTNPSGCQCRTTPTTTSIANVVEVKTAGHSILARKIDGSIWAWGWNQQGELGIGVADTVDCGCHAIPVQTNVGLGNTVFGVGLNHGLVGSP